MYGDNGDKKKRYGKRKKVKVPVSGSKPKKVVEKSVSLRGGSSGFSASLNRYNRSTRRSTSYSGNVGQFSSGVRASTTGPKGTTFSASIDKPYQGKPNVSAGVTFKIGKQRKGYGKK